MPLPVGASLIDAAENELGILSSTLAIRRIDGASADLTGIALRCVGLPVA